MADTVESLTEKVKTLKAAKASAADIKAVNEQLVALKKSAGQAKKKAEAKPDDEDAEGASTPASKVEAKAEVSKPAESVDVAKPAGEKGKKVATKKADDASTQKPDERKKSEKVERKPSEKVVEAVASAATEASVDSLTANVADLQVTKPAAGVKKAGGARKSENSEDAGSSPTSIESSPKPATENKTDAKPKKGGAKAAGGAVPAADDPPKASEPAKSAEVAKAEATADAGAKKIPAAKKNSERKQSTKTAEETPKPAETKTEEPVRIHATGGKTIRILAISGSLRKESFNTSLLRAAQQAAPANVEIVIADISGIPLYNQDTELEPNAAVTKFKKEIVAADAILFATPEYNYSLPGVLKNAIDVASRPWGQNSWANKPTGLWSASVGGFGGLRAQLALRQSAVFLKLNIYPGDEFLISGAGDKFDATGLTDAGTRDKLTAWVASFSKWVQELPRVA